jgi:hypothetical protein
MDADDEEADRGPSVAGKELIRWLAEAAFVGIPIERFLHTIDPGERSLLIKVKDEGTEVLNDAMKSLAHEIVKEYAAAQRRGGDK